MSTLDIETIVVDGVKDLTPYPPGKPIEELERELGITGSIKLASNENPIGPSPKALSAIKEIIAKLHRYPDGSGYFLKEAIARHLDIKFDQIILGNGSNEVIEFVVRTFLRPGEEVIIPTPSFLYYEKVVQAVGGKIVRIPLKDFRLDLGGILERVSGATKIVFLNNPLNPTGTIVTYKEVENFLDNLPSHVIVVIDEAYIEFAKDPECATALAFLEKDVPIVGLRTFSKAYGLAGLRIGYGYAPSKLIGFMERVRQPFNTNIVAQAAAKAALEDQKFLETTLKVVWRGLLQLFQGLQDIGASYFDTQTNFFLIHVNEPANHIYNKMLKEGVIIRSMSSYNMPDYIRVTVGLPEENERFLKTFARVIGK